MSPKSRPWKEPPEEECRLVDHTVTQNILNHMALERRKHHNLQTQYMDTRKGFCTPEKYPFLKSSIDNFYPEDHRTLSVKMEMVIYIIRTLI